MANLDYYSKFFGGKGGKVGGRGGMGQRDLSSVSDLCRGIYWEVFRDSQAYYVEEPGTKNGVG